MGDYRCLAYSICAGPCRLVLWVRIIENIYVSVLGYLRKWVLCIYLLIHHYIVKFSNFLSVIMFRDSRVLQAICIILLWQYWREI